MVPLFVLIECFFFSLVSYSLLPSSSSEWFCSFSHFVWLLSSHCAFPGVGDMCHSLWQGDWITGKQAQDPPGSLHTVVSSVEWSSLKWRGPRWFTVRKTTCFTKTSLVCVTALPGSGSSSWCLFLLGLGFTRSFVLGVSSVLFYAFVHRAFIFDGSLLFSNWKGYFFVWDASFQGLC